MEDVERDVVRVPPQFVASGVRHQGGIYNQQFTPGFTFADVDARMDAATVVLLNAGFIIPKLAAISYAMLEATRLPIWMNVYLSKPGLTTSTQLHTDAQDVLMVQCTGRKRWRVYRTPPPDGAPAHDPFARGKGSDHMVFREEDLVIDTVMEPGQVLYVPAGFPHTTDTILDPIADEVASQPSVHLTVGVDSHLWRLSYSHARQLALARAGASAALADGAPLTTLPLREWTLLHAPLPLGFLSAPLESELESSGGGADSALKAELEAAKAAKAAEAAVAGAAEAGLERKAAQAAAATAKRASKEAAATAAAALKGSDGALGDAIGMSLAARMAAAEPARWAGKVAEELAKELDLAAAGRRLLSHHRDVLHEQAQMYLRAMYTPQEASAAAVRSLTSALMSSMDLLDTHTASLEAWAAGTEATGGFGGAASKVPSKAKAKSGAKKAKKKKKR